MKSGLRMGTESKPAADSVLLAQAQARFNEGLALHHQGQLAQAQEIYRQVLILQPRHAEALHLLGVIAAQSKNHAQAVELISKSIEINPNNAGAYANRGNALRDLGQYQAAIESYDQALALKPDYANAHTNRGIALNELKQQASLDRNDKAIALRADAADIYFRRGVQLSASRQFQAAIDSYDQAIAVKPDFADAYFNRGNALNELKQYQAALDSYNKAIVFKPDSEVLNWVRFITMLHICDWSDAKSSILNLIDHIQHSGKAFLPFQVLALSTSLPLQRKAAEMWINEKHPANFELGKISKRTRREKIRIGYFSMDFCVHPVSALTAELFETHNRKRFEVYAFSYGPNTQDEMRTRLEAAFDKFIDVQNISDTEIVKMARIMEIDIAIDLAGLTGTSRTGIFSLRAAPLQVNYLGYPGSMGADYVDYLIADKQLIPEENRAYYAEKIVYLPCFQANDSKRQISDKVFTRDELGLPQSGFVFCCFSANYKITPGTFDGWMRILKLVKGSVLLLCADNEMVIFNLRKEALLRGVDGNRLVFGKRLPAPEYLARYRAADLFLDTLPFNGGTTASDALWAGLPVLTCTGEAFASRMAASLLHAIDLPELITTKQVDYEALAVQLATHPEQLEAIRQKLERNRSNSPLFDIRRFTGNIEDAYTQMMERHQADLPPEHICVGSGEGDLPV